LRTRRGRQVVTQVVKRSFVDLRPLLGIGPGVSSVTAAHVLAAYSRNGFLPDEHAEAGRAAATNDLEALRIERGVNSAWGYHFDVQTRVFFYPEGAPNTIATSFAGLALLEAHRRTGDARALELAVAAGDFFLAEVPQTPGPAGAFFGYLVGDRTPIHNANMLACALLAELSAATGRHEFAARAAEGVAYTIAHQREDGSWPYGENANLGWVDGFHSGYVLEALLRCRAAGITVVDDAVERGLAFYLDRLFLPDGTPKYKPDSTYPIDIQCVAQGIQTLALAGEHDPRMRDAAWRVAGYGIREMRRPDGAFAFQRRRLWTNRTPHMRWGAAPMLLALAILLDPRLEPAG
jgi:polysaccharide biosynthesis protein VpsJ